MTGLCTLPLDQGPCHDGYKRWYYDIVTTRCRPFIYGGCAGNQNRFKSFDICRAYCGSYEDDMLIYDDNDDDDDDDIFGKSVTCRLCFCYTV